MRISSTNVMPLPESFRFFSISIYVLCMYICVTHVKTHFLLKWTEHIRLVSVQGSRGSRSKGWIWHMSDVEKDTRKSEIFRLEWRVRVIVPYSPLRFDIVACASKAYSVVRHRFRRGRQTNFKRSDNTNPWKWAGITGKSVRKIHASLAVLTCAEKRNQCTFKRASGIVRTSGTHARPFLHHRRAMFTAVHRRFQHLSFSRHHAATAFRVALAPRFPIGHHAISNWKEEKKKTINCIFQSNRNSVETTSLKQHVPSYWPFNSGGR